MKHLSYEQLASIPLFLGIDGLTLAGICEAAGQAVGTVRRGTAAIEAGEQCRSLFFLLEGELEAATTFCGGRFALRETVKAPAVVEPQCLFGLHTTYTRTYTAAAGNCVCLRLPKTLVVNRMLVNEVFRFNFVNMLSSRAQETENRMRGSNASTPEGRMTALFARQMLRTVGTKTLKCRMVDLAEVIGETRLNVSRMLHALESKGLLAVVRGGMVIPAFERLMADVM